MSRSNGAWSSPMPPSTAARRTPPTSWPAACGEQGVQVEMFDTSVTPASYILAAAFRFSHVVLAAPTYNGGVFVTMENLLHDLTAHGLKGRRAAYIEKRLLGPPPAPGDAEAAGAPELGDGGGHRDPPLRPAPGAAGGPGAHGRAAGRKREGVIYCRKSATSDEKRTHRLVEMVCPFHLCCPLCPSGAARFCCSRMAACVAGGAAVSAAKGNTTTTTYDSKGRVTKKVFANKGSLLYTYSEGVPYV